MAEATVFTGFWMNWSKGPILGATLTTTSQHGFLLVSFLALFVRMVGGHFWSVLCFVLHQLKSDSGPQDGLHHQHQLLLRNSQSHTSTLWDLLKVAFFWRANARHSFGRTLPLIALALLHLAIFTAAGLFSSHIASSSDEVLVRSPYCGYMQYPTTLQDLNAQQQEQVADNFISRRTTALWSSSYAQNCYMSNGTASTCNIFASPVIGSTAELTSCPFDGDICIDQNNGSLRIATDYINSDIHLGVNSRRKHSIDYRRVTTCAPLRSDGFRSWNLDEYLNFYYGPQLNSSGDAYRNWTFTYDDVLMNETSKAYYLEYAGLADRNGSDFSPISQLNRTDADVTLIFLTNFANYPEPVNDPYFYAQTPVPSIFGSSNAYTSAIHVGVMGCTEQHQLCDPVTATCSPFTGAAALGDMHQFRGEQLAIVQHVFNAISGNALNNMVYLLGDSALQADLRLDGAQSLYSGMLPADQWVAEVAGWHAYMMAHMQRVMYDLAAGPTDPSFNKFVQAPPTENQAVFDVCANQKIRDSHFYSFSVLGLAITLLAGGTIVLLNLSLSALVGFVQRTTGKGLHRHEHWKLDHSLQVQRMAYENAGIGHWKGKHRLVPVTFKGERFDKPTRAFAEGASIASPLFSPRSAASTTTMPYSPYSPYTPVGLQDASYPFLKPELGVGVVVREESRYSL